MGHLVKGLLVHDGLKGHSFQGYLVLGSPYNRRTLG